MRKSTIKSQFLDTFLQPRLEAILREIGLDYGLTKVEAVKLYLIYYKEYILKHISQGDFSHLKLIGLGHLTPSKKRTLRFKDSKYNTETYQKIIQNIIEYADINEEKVRLEQALAKEVKNEYAKRAKEKLLESKIRKSKK